MIIKVYNSLQKFSKHEIKEDIYYGNNSFYIGDNVDLINCPKKDLIRAKDTLLNFKLSFGPSNYCLGYLDYNEDQLKEIYYNRILLKSGLEYIFGHKKLGKILKSAPKALKWYELNPLKQKYKITPDIIRAIGQDAVRKRINDIVVGSFNPECLSIHTYKTVKIYFVPRGMTELVI